MIVLQLFVLLIVLIVYDSAVAICSADCADSVW